MHVRRTRCPVAESAEWWEPWVAGTRTGMPATIGLVPNPAPGPITAEWVHAQFDGPAAGTCVAIALAMDAAKGAGRTVLNVSDRSTGSATDDQVAEVVGTPRCWTRNARIASVCRYLTPALSEGARGVLMVVGTKGGHATNFKVTGGLLRVYDFAWDQRDAATPAEFDAMQSSLEQEFGGLQDIAFVITTPVSNLPRRSPVRRTIERWQRQDLVR